ncbi:MAG: MerR family transcriptional regulator [Propionibacteriaceae bacterium]|nr:MerR family transcriptional regulator [Propionibacteriaceae bacterium]
MAELSRESGLAVATIKFYLREGLLPPGERTSPNQARYSAEHVRRLRLVRALIDVGGLSVSQTRAVLQAIGESPMAALATAQQAVVGDAADLDADAAEMEWANERYAELMNRTGWQVWPESAAARQARALFISARRSIGADLLRDWPDYADHADAIARADIDSIAQRPDLAATVTAAVIGTVLGGAYLNALRMLAHQHHSGQRWRDEPAIS